MATKKYTMGKNGYYSTLVWDGTYNPDGTKHRKQLRSRKSSADLERMVNKFRREVEERKIIRKTTMSIYEYSMFWLETYKADLKHNSRKYYICTINKYFKPLNVSISNVERIHLYDCLNRAPEKSKCTVYIRFKQILKSAVKDKYLTPAAFNDIFEDFKPPKDKRGEKRTLTEDERKVILSLELDDKTKSFLYILYGCGLRLGETLALHKKDIDFKGNFINVEKTLLDSPTPPRIQNSPKSEHSIRKVPMPDFLVTQLKSYIDTLDTDILFTGKKYDYCARCDRNRMWKLIINELSRLAPELTLPPLTPHNLRHNYCSSLCYQVPTISIKMIARLMGDTERVVMNVYNHIILEKEDVGSALQNALNV